MINAVAQPKMIHPFIASKVANWRHSVPRTMSPYPTRAIIDGGTSQSSTVVAFYDDLGRTIYLPDAWSGGTPSELSVLVHEMVHHLQNLAGMTFACHEEREYLAYSAQQDWLALFGRDLFAEFGTAPSPSWR